LLNEFILLCGIGWVGGEIFSFDYNSYSSIYGLGKIVVCLAIILFVVVLFVKSESNENKLLAFASLIIIAISPLGTNNEVYANLNNMFWVLPVFAYLLCRFVSTNEYIRGVRFSLLILVMALAFQSFMFGITFKFRDGNDGAMNTKVFGNDVLFGMRTTESNAKMLSDLSEIWSANSYADGTVLLYGNVCGFGYVFSTQPAISSPWPSLPSYLQTTFEKEMQGLSDKISNGSITAPVIVIGEEELEGILSGTGAKQEILKNFLEKYNYSEIYNCEKLSVYAVK